MAEGGEIRAFMFCLTFIIVFALLLNTIPTDFQGVGDSGETVIPINPSLVTGFSDSESYSKANFTGTYYEYDDFNERDWIATTDGNLLALAAKKKVLGFWLGGLDICSFMAEDGTDRGNTLAWTEITADAEDGAIRYTLEFANGNTAGYFVCYWNTTAYATATLAWTGEGLYFIHGVGIDTTAARDIGSLLISLLLLQIPEVPVLIGGLLATGPWVCIVFVFWYVIKETMPFV